MHQRAIISSMTPKERRNPKVLDAKRKRRIASGSGTKVEEINKLLKMHRQMADMMKTMGRNGGMLNKFLGRTGGGPSEAELQSMQAELAKLDPKALEQLPDDLKEQVAQGLTGPSGKGGGSLPGLPLRLGPWPSGPRRRTSERIARPRWRNAQVSRNSRKEKMIPPTHSI